jgi:dipeptidyl aminopeptidase/acylaminoacyl peptidase
VPTICIHGTGDTLIPYAESKKFVALLQRNGCQSKFVAIPDGVHLFVGSDKDLSFKPAVEFLDINMH